MARFSHIAGHVALDLVNTVEWRLADNDREEDLTCYQDVVTWCAESDLITTEEANVALNAASELASAEHAHVLRLREALYRVLFANDASAGQVVTEELHQALAAANFVPDEDGWRWQDRQFGVATPRHRIARAIMTLLARTDLDRLHQCEDARCGWVFLDTSRARNRRWCVTKDCGDRNRSRAYYARQKSSN